MNERSSADAVGTHDSSHPSAGTEDRSSVSGAAGSENLAALASLAALDDTALALLAATRC
jgi:hypothetical protein